MCCEFEGFTSSPDTMESFLLLAKSSHGAACSKLILDVLEHPAIYHFAELIDMQNIQQLAASTPYQQLEHFAYGTVESYVKAQLPPLSANQLAKLKQLTLVSLCNQKHLPYDMLLAQLDITSIRELEDLIIDAIYKNLIVGSLDQQKSCLIVESAIGRDLKPGDTKKLSVILSSWFYFTYDRVDQTEKVLAQIDKSIVHVNSTVESAAKESEEYAKLLDTKSSKNFKPEKKSGMARYFCF